MKKKRPHMQTQMLTTIAIAGGLLAVAALARAQEAAPPAPAGRTDLPAPDIIVTTGEGLVLAAPDRAFVSISAESRAMMPKDAQQQNAAAMAAVQQKIRAAGIPAEAVRTIALDLQPEYDYSKGKQTLRGYVARNTIEVRVDEIDKVGEIVDISVASGATNVSSIRFDLKNREATARRALQQAVADARGRAEALAQAATRPIDRILKVEDQSESSIPPPRPMMQSFRQAATAEAETPVTPGQLEIRARVMLTVKLK